MFGGKGAILASKKGPAFDDVWKFNLDIQQWAWIHGSNTYGYGLSPEYGAKCQYAETNTPGIRYNAPLWATENETNIWLFSGNGTHRPVTNDLWGYSPQPDVTGAADWQLFDW